jgi:hypothetical protein
MTVDLLSPPVPRKTSLRSSTVYLCRVAAVFAVLYLFPFFIIRIPSFERWGGSSFGPALDFGFQVPHEDADIVIFGDSTAAVGIDPRQMSADLGLKVLNLPNTGASLHVVGDMNLQRYLQTNRPPRLIVFYFAPWNLNYSHERPGARVYEGEEMLARHGSFRKIAAFVAENPIDSIQFPFRFYSANPPNAIRNLFRHEHPTEEVRTAMGHADPLSRRPPLGAPCVFPKDLLVEHPDTTARELIRTYQTPQTQVLFYVAPMPACDNVNILTSRHYDDLAAAPARQLPVAAFKMDFAYAHLLAAAVPEATLNLTIAVRSRVQNLH